MFVFAEELGGEAGSIVSRAVQVFVEAVVNPLIFVGFAISIIIFLVGILEFIASGQNSEKLDTGKRHMLWGIIGLFIFVSSIWIVNTVAELVQGGGVS